MRLDLQQPSAQRVVLGVRDGRRVLLVIALVVGADLGRQAGVLRLNETNLLLDQLDGTGVPVFPGASVLTTEPPPGTSATSWTGVLGAGGSATAELAVSLTPDGEAEALEALDRWLRDCEASAFVNTEDCPLRVPSTVLGETQADVRWTFAPSTRDSAVAGTAEDGGIVVRGTAIGSVAFNDVVEAAGEPGLTVVPRVEQVEAPYALEVAIGLDGEVDVHLR